MGTTDPGPRDHLVTRALERTLTDLDAELLDEHPLESQSRQTPQQPTVQRYISHQTRGTRVLLFVRERKTFELGTQAFTFLGPATYVERPVAFSWRLPAPMPEELFEVARSVAAA